MPPSLFNLRRLVVFLALLACHSALTAQTALESNGTAVIECESVSVTNNISRSGYTWTSNSAVPGFTGSGYLEALPADGTNLAANWTSTAPEVRFPVTFTHPGTYRVWLRGLNELDSSGSVMVGLDGALPAGSQIDLVNGGNWVWSDRPSNAAPVTITVASAGTHTLHLWMRDSGVRIDRVLLTVNPNFSPVAVTEFWRNQNIYQILTDRFFNGDPSNDNAAGSYNATSGTGVHGGDFLGIEQKLDYIQSLGATALWISPLVVNTNGQYHGYAGTDFLRVAPNWGGLSNLQRLVVEAHKRGILMVQDVVVNHGSTLVDSGDAGFANYLAPPSGYNLRNTSGKTYAPPFDLNATNPALTNLFHNNGAIQNYAVNQQVELGELSSLDDFRTESPFVRTQMANVYAYWIQEAGIDGFRIDTVKHVEMGFWDSWCPAIRQAAAAAGNPNFFQFGEVYDGADSKNGAYTGTKTTPTFKLESVVDYPLYFLVNSVFATGSGNTAQIESRYNNLTTNFYDASALDSLVTFLDNHDQSRFLKAGGGTARLDVALAWLYTARGIPCLYYGTEQDFDGGADPANREDMFDGGYETGASLGDNFNMTSARFQLVAKLNNLRRLYPVLRTGAHINKWNNPGGPGLLAYSRRDLATTQEVFVVLNTATTAQTLTNRPTIYAPGTICVNVLNPAETNLVTSGTNFASVAMPALSFKIFVAKSQVLPLDPVVTAVSPAHDAASVAPGSSITLTFSKAMNTNSVQAAFSTLPATTGTFAWNAATNTLTYTPSSLAASTLHRVRLAATAADAVAGSGKKLTAAFESRFTTGVLAGPAAPAVTARPATNLTSTTATLQANVTPNNASTVVWFEFGPSSSYGSVTVTQSLGSGASPVAVTQGITGLTPGATYHFRAVASNAVSVVLGADGTFTTTGGAALPVVSTTAASGVGTTVATLNGTLNPNGSVTSARFDYGVQAGVLNQSTPLQSLGSGSNSLPVSAALTGLDPGSTYYFELVAVTTTNSTTNTFRGAVLNFTTVSVIPTATTDPATGVVSNTATLNATVNANGFATSVAFEYGTTVAYGTTTPWQDIGSAALPVTVQALATNLAFGQTVHFRVLATNANGTATGLDQSFLTGFPAPAVTSDPVTRGTNLTTVTLRGTVNPLGSPATGWIEFGPTTNYGFTSRTLAGDNADTYASFTYGSSGGTGFGPHVKLTGSSGNSGGIYLANSTSGNRQVDGSNSFGVYAGGSRGKQALYRLITNPRACGTFTVTARFDLNNAKGFSGFNLKSAATNSDSFSANELVSLGLAPTNGNNGLLVTGTTKPSLDFGTELRGALLELRLDYNAAAGIYTATAKQQGSSNVFSVSGFMKGSNTLVRAFAVDNANNELSNQNVIYDSPALAMSDALGSGLLPVLLTHTVTNLATNTLYHYRTVGFSPAGLTYGPDATFSTSPDLAPIDAWRLGWFGTTTNAGDAADGANPSGDGIPNLMKYALGLDPTHPTAAALPAALVSNDVLSLTFQRQRDATDITYRVEATSALETWTLFWSSVDHPYPGTNPVTDVTVSEPVSPTNTARFLRLNITRP